MRRNGKTRIPAPPPQFIHHPNVTNSKSKHPTEGKCSHQSISVTPSAFACATLYLSSLHLTSPPPPRSSSTQRNPIALTESQLTTRPPRPPSPTSQKQTHFLAMLGSRMRRCRKRPRPRSSNDRCRRLIGGTCGVGVRSGGRLR